MGIAVVVLNILNKIDEETSILMLGIAIICLSINLLDDKRENN